MTKESYVGKLMREGHEAYMLRRIREEQDATIRRLASDSLDENGESLQSIRDDIFQTLERIEKKIDKISEKSP